MEVQLTPDQKAFVRRAFESRRLQREEVAVTEALPCGNCGFRGKAGAIPG